MAEEKIVTINLRKKMLKKGFWMRNKIAVNRIRELVGKASKAERVVIERKLNDKVFSNPLKKAKVRIVKIDDKSVRAELAG